MAFVCVSRDGNEIQRFALQQERVTIGREDDCDLQLSDATLSRHHCELTWDGQGYTLTDYSRNGTFLDGERIEDATPLGHDMRFEIGPFTLQYCEGDVPQLEVTIDTSYQPTLIRKFEPATQKLSVQKVHVQVCTGKHKQKYCVDRLPMTIGGASTNTITIQHDPYVSRTHCAVELSERGLVLRDCASSNGTWWGDMAVQRHQLPERGKFHVGNTEVQYHIETSTEAIEPAGQQRFGELLGVSPAMQQIFSLVARVAPSHATVLIEGESGTGKELLARAVHAASGRANRPFVALNCGALPASVIESELFGHERGAFTGASAQHKGVFEQASGGSIFLDEIGEMPLELQTHLLRVLESRTLRRVGGNEDVAVDVRVIAATNRNLAQMVAEESFREDLYYRLCIIPIHIPPLRDRPADIRLLAEHFMRTLRSPRSASTFSTDAMTALLDYDWPGNARELRHTIERSLIMQSGAILTADALMFTPRNSHRPANGRIAHEEMDMIHDALREHRGNVTVAAQALGISRSTLTTKVRHFGIDVQSLRKRS